VPARVMGIAQVRKTLQYERSGKEMGKLNTNVPNLATMVRGAIRVLEGDDDGFLLVIEGGAPDWANHDKNLERMVEEMMDFNAAAAAVVKWLEASGRKGETLLIVTADHESGQLWGPDSGSKSKTPFDLPKNKGKGNLPDAKYHSTGHTSVLVPVYATGPGSERFAQLVDGTDPKAAEAWHMSGRYVDNTDIFTVMKAAITP